MQQIIFTGKVDAEAIIYYIYEKSKETVRILQRNNKSFVISING